MSMRIGYDDADSLLTYPHVNNLSVPGQPIRMHRARSRSAANEDPGHRFLRCRDAGVHPHHTARPTTRRTPHTSRTPRTTTPHTSCAPHTHHPTRTRHTPGTHPARTWPPPAHTKRARTNWSGRATYSAQALGRLPWFAPFLRRSRRLRPRFDMSFSLGLLSRLKHFCTHWPKPPRHNTSPATKVTEKRAAAPASSARVTPRGSVLS